LNHNYSIVRPSHGHPARTRHRERLEKTPGRKTHG
jgi:hypothetical protein